MAMMDRMEKEWKEHSLRISFEEVQEIEMDR